VNSSRIRRRFWLEALLAAVSGIVGLLTVLVPDWAEVIIHIDPDQGNGTFEIAATVITVALALGFAWAARIEWRRPERLRARGQAVR
jgi:hypothetical protein